jgi:hypothetical protein
MITANQIRIKMLILEIECLQDKTKQEEAEGDREIPKIK